MYLWHSAPSHISVRIKSHSLQTTGNHPTIRASNIVHLKMSGSSKSQTEKDRPIKHIAQWKFSKDSKSSAQIQMHYILKDMCFTTGQNPLSDFWICLLCLCEGVMREEEEYSYILLTHWGRVTRICVFNTRLFSLHNTLNL